MKDIFYKILIVCILYSGHNIRAQEEVSKTIEKSYKFTNAGELQLENKYGNIIINGWDQNEIQIIVDIKVSKKEKEDAQELLTRIKPFFTVSGDFINIFSNIEEKSNSFFSRMLNRANPFDFDKGNIQIDYKINLPVNAEAQLTNKFGDIIISDWKGRLKVNLQHGDMWINNNLTNANIETKFGKLQAKSITYGNIELKNSELDLDTSEDLRITSSGSTITIDSVKNLEMYSSKDKATIRNSERIQGELRFSNVRLEEIKENIDLTLDVADLWVNEILKNDAHITIKQKSSELNINISNLSFDFSASLEQGLLRIPKSFVDIKTDVVDSKKKLRNITASYGLGKKGEFNITGKKGVIILKER